MKNHTPETSNVYLLVAQSRKVHAIGEDLVKPVISSFLNIVLQKGDKGVKGVPQNDNTASTHTNARNGNTTC